MLVKHTVTEICQSLNQTDSLLGMVLLMLVEKQTWEVVLLLLIVIY